MRNITIKIESSKDSLNKTIEQFTESLRKRLDDGNTYNFSVSDKVDIDQLKETLERDFDLTARDGWTGGCYGARDGSSGKGLTLFVSPNELPDRFIDEEGDEEVNYWALLNEYGDCKGKVDEDTLERFIDMFGLEEEFHENSYNYAGHSSETPCSLFGINFKVYKGTDGSCLAVVEFHCGGDVRGNYTSPYLFKFDDIDDLYSAVFPCAYLKEEEV